MLKVEQADREAAADFVRAWDEEYGAGQNDFGPSEVDSVWLRSGDHDGELIVQAFAKHREDTALPLREAMERAKVLIGARNDALSEAARQSNIAEAWHVLDKALHPDTTGGE